MPKQNLHSKHRQRMKKRFLENGLDGFSDHEVLELLLFFGIPQCNTNETAHRLINRFGSFSGVLDAEFSDLVQELGIGDHTATLLTFMPSLFRRYSMDKQENDGVFKDMDRVGEYLVNNFIGSTREKVDILLFDPAMKLIAHLNLCEGSPESTFIDPERVADMVFSHHAANFVLCHNHPFGNAEPSDTDLAVTRKIYYSFKPFKKNILEHIIVSGGEYKKILAQSIAFDGE